MKITPPKNSLRFLRWFCREDYVEEIEGDLMEVFEKQYTHSPATARWKFRWSVMKYFRPEFIRSYKRNYRPNPIDMFRHNFLLTLRSLRRYKITFVINLMGLSTGLACTLLIYLWVHDEFCMDKFHEKDSQLYQAMLNLKEAGRIRTDADTPAPLANALNEELPEVEMAAEDTDPAVIGDNFTISDGKVNLRIHGKFSGPSYFDMFSFKIIQGDKKSVLMDKHSIVISEKVAQSLFPGIDNVVGKSLEWSLLSLKGNAIVSGVFKDLPSNATDPFDFVMPFKVFEEIMGKDIINWGNYNAFTYVQLKEGTDPIEFNKKIENFIRRKSEWSDVTVFVRPFSDKYLYNKYENGVLVGGRIAYVKLFSIIAIFIIVIACINFMNLATARASRRLKEIGIKKAVGAGRSALILQHMSESLVMAFLSLMVSIFIVVLFLPQFNSVTGKQLSLNFDRESILVVLGVTFATGILSGSYPALYLSAFNPITVLKGKLETSFGELWARKGLVVFQFTLSILLIVAVVVVYQQVNYIQNKNLGYDRDNVITFPNEGKAVKNVDLFLGELTKVEGVVSASATAHNFLDEGGYTTDLAWEGKGPEENMRFCNATVYYNLLETLGMQLQEGRSFSKDFANESENLLLNETAIKVMGLKNPVGKTVKLWGEDKKVIGVVKDFHFASLHEKVEPLFFRFDSTFLPYIMVKIRTGQAIGTLERLTKFYRDFNPGYSFDYTFIDQKYQLQYMAELRVATLSRYFAGFAILISCLGLFGLATFTAERRLKEIGIRKVLGANEFGIFYLLSSDFTKMVMTAILIALPLSYVVTKNWLNEFAYRIELEWWFFIGAGCVALVIAWFTIGIQMIKAAKVNPSQCLKDE